MDVSIIGFVKADKYRLRIMEVLKSEATPKAISHKLRISLPRVNKSLEELSKKGLVEKREDSYFLTEDGIKTLAQISKEMR
jgi:Mn-dependent DtxR family transcriptional regulator